MISKWIWMLRTILRRLWVRVAAFALLAIVVAALAPLLSPLVPPAWAEALGGGAVDQILSILATSMLAVTTFSLSIAVNAYTAAASTATPRATALLQEDPTTQTTLATFLGAFVYAMVAIIGLNAGYYASGGRFVLFLSTILVVVIVVFALLRWIGYLPSFGRMDNTLDRLEDAAHDALRVRTAAPWLGGRPHSGDVPNGCHAILPDQSGYVQHIDMEALQECAEVAGVQIYIAAVPGDFVHPAAPLAHLLGACDEVDAIRGAFFIGRVRSFDQDPRYGMVVLAEIASRALSPGINDPGTAIAVIGRQLAVLARWQECDDHEVRFDAVHVPSVEPADMVAAAFRPIARDGAGHGEVMAHLIAALDALNRIAPQVYAEGVAAMLAECDERLARVETLSDRDLTDIDRIRRRIS